jgi:hypothetical protein
MWRGRNLASYLEEYGNLIAFREFNAFYAVGPDFMGKDCLVHHLEPMVLEETRPIGEGEDPVKAQADGFGKAGFDQLASDSPAMALLLDDQGTDFSQVLPADVHGTGTDDPFLSILHVYIMVPKVIIKFTQGPGQHLPLFSRPLDQLLNFPNIADFSFPNGHFLEPLDNGY